MCLIRAVIVSLLFINAYSDQCVTYNFEDNFETLFSPERFCTLAQTVFDIGLYSDIGVEPPHSNSEKFISPLTSASCISSFIFPLNTEGTFEVNVYMDSLSGTDQIVVIVQGITDSYDVPVGQAILLGSQVETDTAFQTLQITWLDPGKYYDEAYVVFLGLAAAESRLLIDSFRYIPPDTSPESCIIYDNNLVTTETSFGSTDNTDMTTEGFSTTEDSGLTTENTYSTKENSYLTTEEFELSTENPSLTTEDSNLITENSTTEAYEIITPCCKWRPYIIPSVIVIGVFILILISWLFYQCSKRKEKYLFSPKMLDNDMNVMPKQIPGNRDFGQKL